MSKQANNFYQTHTQPECKEEWAKRYNQIVVGDFSMASFGIPDWQVDCPACGVFTQIQKTDPTICPRCGEPDIDTFNLGS
jgi:ssDNA-binding Zn-finger/Zn-ribbon topoisomerase 1